LFLRFGFLGLAAETLRGGAFRVGGDRGDIAETFVEAFHEIAMEWGSGRRQLVVGPQALLAFLDEAAAEEVGEVAGGLGLRNAEDGDDVADAEFATAEEMKDAQTSGVGESTEE
jgi:hypothetical protein